MIKSYIFNSELTKLTATTEEPVDDRNKVLSAYKIVSIYLSHRYFGTDVSSEDA